MDRVDPEGLGGRDEERRRQDQRGQRLQENADQDERDVQEQQEDVFV